ncbi:hypothetical protein [Jatrophihabitans sp.]|uniref:hypothetical protein n=1 Tax=Jatrophihabitans sp. TaxID=1932789 RepID=UPI002BA113F4|nr:hypothetical protein [Jatrophihabitans sp.]
MIALAVVVSLLVVFGNLALVAMFVLRWERRGQQPADDRSPAADRRPAGARSG